MSLTGSCYAGLTTLKTYLDIDGDDTTYDNVLNDIIPQIGEMIESFCGRVFAYKYNSEKVDIKNAFNDTFRVKQFPIQSVVALTDNDTLKASTEYFVYEDTGVIKSKNIQTLKSTSYRGYYWTEGRQMVDIDYYSGYLEIPQGIQLAAKELAATIFYGRKYSGFKSGKIGGFSFSVFADEIPPRVRGLLMPYRRCEI